MGHTFDRQALLLSLQRALLAETHPDIRQVSGELDSDLQTVRLRFEYNGESSEIARECGSNVAGQVIGDFPPTWQLDEQHVVAPFPGKLAPLAHVAYRRWESEHAA